VDRKAEIREAREPGRNRRQRAGRLAAAGERALSEGELLVASRAQLQALAAQLPLAEERERRRIARGLHDQVGHPLAVARMRLGELRDTAASAEGRRALDEVSALLAQAIAETRSLTFELSSPVLYELGLEPALQSLGERIAGLSGLTVSFATDRRPKPLAEDAAVILFRVAEELLLNVVKHARARAVSLAVARVGDRIRIGVEDDGVGLDTAGLRPAGGLGLFGVRQRLAHLGGRLTIDSAPGSGTRMVVFAPLEGARRTGGPR
jgi:signal transduction histidine kinase